MHAPVMRKPELSTMKIAMPRAAMISNAGPAVRFPAAKRALALALVAGLGTLVAACDDDGRLPSNSRHYVAISAQTQTLMAEKGMNARSPILLRAYKKESELEVWKQNASGEYALLKTYPMCRWSGQLGPKKTEGDRQVPEGFYAITPSQLNPNSSFYLSFNVGYPNAYDRSYGRTGSLIMVHGACSSRGCFSMTDEQIADIYALTREAFGGGQKAVQLQSLPFRMNAQNLAKYRADENMPFWKNLKEGADHFDVTKREPQVSVCSRRYVFNANAPEGSRIDASASCPPLQQDEAVVASVRRKNAEDERQVASLVQSGMKAVKRVYHDGDQHHSFKHTSYAAAPAPAVGSPVTGGAAAPQGVSRVAAVSQPDALEAGAVEVPHDLAKGLSRQALIARAAEYRMREATALAAVPADKAKADAKATEAKADPKAAATAVATRNAKTDPKADPKANPKAVAAAPALPAASATALVATEPAKKDEPVFYRRWLGKLGGLTADSTGAEEVKTQAVEAPVPPKAPQRR
jgi:murein L,D-transpeptidase YafK